MPKEERIVTPAYLWFDTEFTSLDPEQGRLLQVALVVTDAELNRLTAPEQDVNLCIRLEPDVPVSPWVAEHLADLLRQCRSAQAVPLAEADRRLAALVDAVAGPVVEDVRRRPVLSGNTVYMDLALAKRFLPAFTRRLHYRLLDVSTIKILWNAWSGGPVFDKADPELLRQYLPASLTLPAAGAHDAHYDIHASLAELNYYRQQLGWQAATTSVGNA